MLRWYWTRYGNSDDYRRADVREAIGGEWEQVWPYFGRTLLPWERVRNRPPFDLEWHPRVPDDVGLRCYGRWRRKGGE